MSAQEIKPKETILIVDDEEDILELLQYNLQKDGYKTLLATTGEQGMNMAKTELPDLIVLDLMLPGADGMEVCRALKTDSKTAHIPILMLTAKDGEPDIVAGLEIGANDYVTKPFSPRILLARVKANLRTQKGAVFSEQDTIKKHELTINLARREVYIEGALIDLTFTEFEVLVYLARNAGRVFTRYQIVDAVKGSDYPVTQRSVDVQIVGLRKKLESCGKYIETIRGVGYRFKD
jgi:two-component system phosphate regulon response regulator PhoB